MQRPSGDNQIERLEESDPQFLASRSEIRKWVARCTLARDPEMPSALRDRAADNWRVLLAIADDLGHGDAARSAAIKLSSNCLYEDAGVKLLSDIRSVFQLLGKDRIASAVLVEALLGLDDGIWGEWRGPNDDRLPRKLSQSELARLLRPFQIRSKTIWPARRGPRERSKRGYLRNEFEPAWRAYCPPADTPTQASKIIVTAEVVMGNRAAMVSQADIARVIRACRQEGVRVIRIVVRKDSVSIEAGDADESNPQDIVRIGQSTGPEKPLEQDEEIVL
jgi:hypothetical protein